MTIVEPDSETFSIVVLGDFNPAILQPLWFSVNELISRQEADNADIDVIHKEFASFLISGIKVQVDHSRLGMTAMESQRGPTLRDLVIGTLLILDHTPLKAIGLNRDLVFEMESDEAWHGVGDRLAPKDDWIRILESPGMQQIVVEGKRPDCSADRVHVRVQPSGTRKILIAVNQHYQLKTTEEAEVRERHNEAVRVLNDDWQSFFAYALEAARGILQPSSSGVRQSEKQS